MNKTEVRSNAVPPLLYPQCYIFCLLGCGRAVVVIVAVAVVDGS